MEVTGNGPSNFDEFGNTTTEQGFKALFEMDATQHVEHRTAYPAALLLVGMNNPRTDPWYSAKFAAHLQAATTSGKPVLLRVNYGGGHFAGEGLGENEALESMADMISFDLWQLGAPEFQPRRY
jgi:prolyl oligopeptidase